ncbi:MAG: response regulator [Acidobacteriota bacterium]
MAASNPRILCTEDDIDTREMIAIILRDEGFDVICPESSAKALELARTSTFDLLLMDNWTPGLSGTELCEAIRKFDVKTPILFYSGAAYEKDKEDARLAGAQGYLTKPVSCEHLVAEIARLIEESRDCAPDSSRRACGASA